jgi:hypothetical protein
MTSPGSAFADWPKTGAGAAAAADRTAGPAKIVKTVVRNLARNLASILASSCKSYLNWFVRLIPAFLERGNGRKNLKILGFPGLGGRFLSPKLLP